MDTAAGLGVNLRLHQRGAWLGIGLAMLGLCAPASAETHALWKKADAECPANDLSRQAKACIVVDVYIDVLRRPNVTRFSTCRTEIPLGHPGLKLRRLASRRSFGTEQSRESRPAP